MPNPLGATAILAVPRNMPRSEPPSDAARCPQCGYDLRSLPKIGHCPECGEVYTEVSGRLLPAPTPLRLAIDFVLGPAAAIAIVAIGVRMTPALAWVGFAIAGPTILVFAALQQAVRERILPGSTPRVMRDAPSFQLVRTAMLVWTMIVTLVGLVFTAGAIALAFVTVTGQV
ncbi:MAG: hypothetical protein KDA22_04820 [Phycisphaerales bacterium]|nr:hypothetical protein [Phycisphaerales bacterium]